MERTQGQEKEYQDMVVIAMRVAGEILAEAAQQLMDSEGSGVRGVERYTKDPGAIIGIATSILRQRKIGGDDQAPTREAQRFLETIG